MVTWIMRLALMPAVVGRLGNAGTLRRGLPHADASRGCSNSWAGPGSGWSAGG